MLLTLPSSLVSRKRKKKKRKRKKKPHSKSFVQLPTHSIHFPDSLWLFIDYFLSTSSWLCLLTQGWFYLIHANANSGFGFHRAIEYPAADLRVGYVVRTRSETPETNPLQVNNHCLTGRAYYPNKGFDHKGKQIHFYTNSKYTCLILHDHAAFWMETGLLATMGTSIKHSKKIMELLYEVLLLQRVAVMHCQEYQKEGDWRSWSVTWSLLLPKLYHLR